MAVALQVVSMDDVYAAMRSETRYLEEQLSRKADAESLNRATDRMESLQQDVSHLHEGRRELNDALQNERQTRQSQLSDIKEARSVISKGEHS